MFGLSESGAKNVFPWGSHSKRLTLREPIEKRRERLTREYRTLWHDNGTATTVAFSAESTSDKIIRISRSPRAGLTIPEPACRIASSCAAWTTAGTRNVITVHENQTTIRVCALCGTVVGGRRCTAGCD